MIHKSRYHRVAALLLMAALALACKRSPRVQVQQTDEETPQLASIVHVADPRVSAQLISGFFNVEQNSWRWTGPKFVVLLRTPRAANKRGAILQLKFAIPEPVIAKLGTISLGATVDNTRLARESYTQPGEFTYVRDLPASLMASEAVKVSFDVDKSLRPGGGDERDLGIVATSIGLELK